MLLLYSSFTIFKSLTECYNYRFLSESNRARTFTAHSYLGDHTLSAGWYRFSGGAGNRMADSCTDYLHCGAYWPGWLNGSHPAVADGNVQRRVCFGQYWQCCYYSTYISVRNCGGFHVYKLKPLTGWSLRYCGNGFVPATPLAPGMNSFFFSVSFDLSREILSSRSISTGIHMKYR